MLFASQNIARLASARPAAAFAAKATVSCSGNEVTAWQRMFAFRHRFALFPDFDRNA
jgi:hypothetical protein